MHIPTYYNVISRYNHDLQCLWGFSIDPRIFGITLQNRKIMLLVVIIMNCNDLWGFSIDLPYFDYNSAEQENHVLCIFTF
jgi:hypothetical protein